MHNVQQLSWIGSVPDRGALGAPPWKELKQRRVRQACPLILYLPAMTLSMRKWLAILEQTEGVQKKAPAISLLQIISPPAACLIKVQSDATDSQLSCTFSSAAVSEK